MRSRRAAVLGVLLADARAHKLQTLTTLLGVAVGVATIVAIRASSEAALDRFQRTVASFSGNATHQITAVEPIPAERLLELRTAPGVAAVQPVVASTVVALDAAGAAAGTLRLVGLDPFQSQPFVRLDEEALERAAGADPSQGLFERLMLEPGCVLIARSTFDRLALDEGGRLTVRRPRGVVELRAVPLDDEQLAIPDPPIALADLATAQEVLDLGSRVLRFDLVLEEGTDAIPLRLGERLERPERRGERASTMTQAFRTNLLCLGFLAVLVGAFVAFNMAQFAVTRRRPLLGRLRCLGTPARDVLVAVLLEAVVLGALGSGLGLIGGRWLARAMVGEVTRTMSMAYGPVASDPQLGLDVTTAAVAVMVGIAATVGASWGPARDAARTSPAAVAGGVPREPAPPLTTAVLFFAAAPVLLAFTESAVLLPAGAVLCLLLGLAAVMPRLLGVLVSRPPRATWPALAAGRIERSLRRTGAAAGALAMPLAMTIAILVMVGSFRDEVSEWSDATLGADIYVRPVDIELAPDTLRLDGALVDDLQALPGLVALDTLRLHEQVDGSKSFLVAGARLEKARRRGSLRVLDGGTRDELVARALAGDALVSEPLHRRTGLGPGDTIALDTRTGRHELPVAGVFQDFSLDRGYVLLSEEAYVERFGDTGVHSAALLLEEGRDVDALATSLTGRYPDAEFQTVDRLRGEVLEAFDQTFAITYVLQSISTALAVVGILTALLCLHLERKHELGILRALGARHRAVAGLLLLEALVLMFVAAMASIPMGLVLAWILVAVVNTRSFGWSFPMTVDPAGVAGVVVLALAAGALAGLVPWLMVRRARVAGLLEVRS